MTDSEKRTRFGRVKASATTTKAQVQRYMPANYQVTHLDDDGYIHFAGVDDCGWTMDEYVIPRLASGLHFAEEIDG